VDQKAVRRRRRHGAGLAVAWLLFVAACQTMPSRTPRWAHAVSVTEIQLLSVHGVPPDEIVAKIDRAGIVYHLTEDQYAALRANGVTPRVIAHMRDTYRQAVEAFPKIAADDQLDCWYLGYDGYWYGGGPWGFHPDC
jgi:hypothetical protein